MSFVWQKVALNESLAHRPDKSFSNVNFFFAGTGTAH